MIASIAPMPPACRIFLGTPSIDASVLHIPCDPASPVRNGVNIHARHRLTTYGVILSNTPRAGKRALVIFCADSRFKAVSTDAVISTFASHFSTSPAERPQRSRCFLFRSFHEANGNPFPRWNTEIICPVVFTLLPPFPSSFSPSHPQLPVKRLRFSTAEKVKGTRTPILQTYRACCFFA